MAISRLVLILLFFVSLALWNTFIAILGILEWNFHKSLEHGHEWKHIILADFEWALNAIFEDGGSLYLIHSWARNIVI